MEIKKKSKKLEIYKKTLSEIVFFAVLIFSFNIGAVNIFKQNYYSLNTNRIDSTFTKLKKDTTVFYVKIDSFYTYTVINTRSENKSILKEPKPNGGKIYKRKEVYYKAGKEIGSRTWYESGNLHDIFYGSKFENATDTFYSDLKQKQIILINYFKNDTVKKSISFFSNQQIKTEGDFINDYTPIGAQKTYNINGKLKQVKYYDEKGKYLKTIDFTTNKDSVELNDTIKRKYTEYYKNGNKKISGQIKSGKYEGVFSYWDEKGVLLYTEEYDNRGVLQKINYANSKTKEEVHKKNIQEIKKFIEYLDKHNTSEYDTIPNALDTIISQFFCQKSIISYFKMKKHEIVNPLLNPDFFGVMIDSIKKYTSNKTFNVFNYMDAQKMKIKGLVKVNYNDFSKYVSSFFLIENVYFISFTENGKTTNVYLLMENNKLKSITPIQSGNSRIGEVVEGWDWIGFSLLNNP